MWCSLVLVSHLSDAQQFEKHFGTAAYEIPNYAKLWYRTVLNIINTGNFTVTLYRASLVYNTNYNKKNSDKLYIVVVVCLLVMVNQWKQFNLMFIQLQRFSGFLLWGVFGSPLDFGWRFTSDHRSMLHWKICMTNAASVWLWFITFTI